MRFCGQKGERLCQQSRSIIRNSSFLHASLNHFYFKKSVINPSSKIVETKKLLENFFSFGRRFPVLIFLKVSISKFTGEKNSLLSSKIWMFRCKYFICLKVNAIFMNVITSFFVDISFVGECLSTANRI